MFETRKPSGWKSCRSDEHKIKCVIYCDFFFGVKTVVSIWGLMKTVTLNFIKVNVHEYLLAFTTSFTRILTKQKTITKQDKTKIKNKVFYNQSQTNKHIKQSVKIQGEGW